MIRTILKSMVIYGAATVSASAQTVPLSSVIPIASQDAARLMADLLSLIQAAQKSEGEASWWRDACQSTAACYQAPAAAVAAPTDPDKPAPVPH